MVCHGWQGGSIPFADFEKKLKSSIFTCPSVPDSEWTKDKIGTGMNVWLAKEIMNVSIAEAPWDLFATWAKTPIKRSLIKYPSQVLLIGDRYNNWHVSDDIYTWSDPAFNLNSFRHQKPANILHCDGHVKAYTKNNYHSSRY